MAAGSIIIDLLMKTGSFETDSKRAEKRLREIEKTAKQVGVVIGTALSTAAIGLTALVKSAIDSADATRDLSIRVGVSTEVLSAYGFAASQTGTDIETLAKGLKVLAKNTADGLNPTNEYAKVFDALGIKLTDNAGKLRKLGDLLPEIADRFKSMEDGTTKAALAQSLFGRAGLDLTEFLNQGSEGLREFTDRAAELGLVVDAETATAADNFNDTLGELKAVSQGYALHLAKELLPDLQALASEFTNTATEGNKVKEMAEGTAQFLRGLATVAHIVSSAFELVGTGLATIAAQGVAVAKMLSGDLAGGIRLYKEASEGFDREWDEAFGRERPGPPTRVRLVFAGEGPDPEGLFKRPAQAVDEAAIATALSNPTLTKAAGPKKSESEKEAERLLRMYDSLVAGQREQIALFGDTSEAAKVRYATEHGELAALAPELKANLIANAERLDQMRAEEEVQEQLEELERRRAEAFARVSQTIADQLDIVRMSADEQEIWNNLRWAGVNADSAFGRQIIESTRALQEQRDIISDQIEAMDSLRDAGSGFLRDIKEGKGIWDALGDAIDKVADKLFDLAAENLMDQIFGKQGDPAGGSTGGFFASLLGAFGFGGARAGGGDVMGGRAYLVGEDGPEMFVPRTAGMILPTPALAGMGGGRFSQTNHFHYAAPPDPRTQQQTAARVGFESQRAISRNGR